MRGRPRRTTAQHARTAVWTSAGIATALTPSSVALAGDAEPVWASRVVYGVLDGEAVYEPGIGEAMTFGPFGPANALWRDPESVLGKPNTVDYDDLSGAGPVPGGFAGGPMRRIFLAWPAWQWGSSDSSNLGLRPGWLDGRRQNGVSLTQGSQLVIEFAEPVENNPDDGGAFHWGIDLIVHGNSSFTTGGVVEADADLGSLVLSGGVLGEPIEIAVAQHADGPWYRSAVPGDLLFPSQPWTWDNAKGAWTGAEQDWRKPVDPGLTTSSFAGVTAAQAAMLYGGSAGGAGVDFDELIDESGAVATLPWARYVRFRDPAGDGGEICAVADVPGSVGCGIADLAAPQGVLDLADISAFVGAFSDGDTLADLAPPTGTLDLSDISAFVSAFVGGCP